MTEKLTEETFAKHLNTKFKVDIEAPQRVELKLVELKAYENRAEEPGGMERFSAFFSGPSDAQLKQGTYTMQHEQIGEFELFLVPVGRAGSSFLYEAVFNYFK